MSTTISTSQKHVILFRYHGDDTWKAGTPADLAAELRDLADKLSDFPRFSKLAEVTSVVVAKGQVKGVLDSLAELKLEVLSLSAEGPVEISATADDVDATLLEAEEPTILQGRDLVAGHIGLRIRVTDLFGATYTGTVQPLKAGAGLGHHQFLGIHQDVRAQRPDWVDVIGLAEKVEVFA